MYMYKFTYSYIGNGCACTHTYTHTHTHTHTHRMVLTQSLLLINSQEDNTRKLSGIFTNDLDQLSPLTVDFQGSRFSSFDSSSLDKPNTDGMRAHTRTEASDSSHGGAVTTEHRRDPRTLRPISDGGNSRYVEHERGSWVNIKVVKNGSAHQNEEDNGGSQFVGGSLDRVGQFVVS